MKDLNYYAEFDIAYKERLLKVMRENMALGLSNEHYENIVASMVNNAATFRAVYAYSK